MKKFILSILVIGAFLFYGWYQRQGRSEVNIPSPKISANSATPTPGSSSSSAAASSTPPTATPTKGNGYKDGEYTGSAAQNIYGTIQVKAIISNGKITDVQFLQYPNDRGESIQINTQAIPFLQQEAIQVQSANVDIVSGATDSSQSFSESLQSALAQAKG